MVVSTSTPSSSATSRPGLETNALKEHTYEIKDRRLSDSTLVFFAHHRDTHQKVVIKILRQHEDMRYSLKEPQERLACQIEALEWNQKFTPGIYLGLGRVVKPDLNLLEQKAKENLFDSITIENIVNDVQHFSR